MTLESSRPAAAETHPMDTRLSAAFESELLQAVRAEDLGDAAAAWRHLERAHILSQRHTAAHVRAHLRMLGWGWRQRDAREIAGQVTRVVAAALFSRLWVPVGNTGGANVSAFQAMPIPPELQRLIEDRDG